MGNSIEDEIYAGSRQYDVDDRMFGELIDQAKRILYVLPIEYLTVGEMRLVLTAHGGMSKAAWPDYSKLLERLKREPLPGKDAVYFSTVTKKWEFA